MTTTRNAEAHNLGRLAYSEGRSMAPMLDARIAALITDLPVGGGAVRIMKSFVDGFEAAATEAANAVFA